MAVGTRSVVEWLEPLEVRELVRLWWRGFTLEMTFLILDITKVESSVSGRVAIYSFKSHQKKVVR